MSVTTDTTGHSAKSHHDGAANARTAADQSPGSRELQNLLADIQDLILQTTAYSGDELAAAKAVVIERIAAVKESVEAAGDELTQRARKTIAATNTRVHEQPWMAVGVGVSVGFLLGFVLARRL